MKKKHPVREYAEAILTAFLVAFLIRSFVVEAFKIPSGSMIPTLMIGDHIFVNKFAYGFRIPLTKKKIVTFDGPKRGEAVVFIYPLDESKDFIKRVIGLPGDCISIRGDEVVVNGEPLRREPIQVQPGSERPPGTLAIGPDAVTKELGVDAISIFAGWRDYSYFSEKVGTIRHLTQFDFRPSFAEQELVVPEGHLFVMGDNRDNSSDSREWGFVPVENIKGRAMFIWLSLNYEKINQGLLRLSEWVRWDRFGRWIH